MGRTACTGVTFAFTFYILLHWTGWFPLQIPDSSHATLKLPVNTHAYELKTECTLPKILI